MEVARKFNKFQEFMSIKLNVCCKGYKQNQKTRRFAKKKWNANIYRKNLLENSTNLIYL